MLTEKIGSRNIRHVGVTINAVTENTTKNNPFNFIEGIFKLLRIKVDKRCLSDSSTIEIQKLKC